MTIEFGILSTVFFRHSYFSSSKLECLTVAVSQESMSMFRNKGLLFKPFKDGFRILYETSVAGKTRSREDVMKENVTLRFSLGLHDPYFYNYTAGAFTNMSSSAFHFHNLSDGKDATMPSVLLHEEEFASEKNLVPLESLHDTSFVRPFGLIDLRLSGSLEQTYTIRFREKSTYWRYLLVSDHLKGLNSPAVLGSGVSFKGPENIVLPDNRQALAFVSADPIGLAESTKDLFQLVENYEPASGKYKMVMRALPVPDTRAASFTTKQESAIHYSEIFI